MTHDEFKKKYLGGKTDYDGQSGYQCVDLAKRYTDDVFGYVCGSFGGSAKTGRETGSPFNEKWMKVTKGTPKKGDMIFRTRKTYGHVAIVDKVVGSTVTVIEQNHDGGGSGVNGNAIRLTDYQLSSVAGRYSYITIDETAPLTIAIRQYMKLAGDIRNLSSSQTTKDRMKSNNDYFRQFGY